MLPDAVFPALGLVAACVRSVLRNRRVGLIDAVLLVAAFVVFVGGLPPALEWLLLILASGCVWVAGRLVRRATQRAERASDLEALERRSRWGFYLMGDQGWTAYNDLTAWRLLAQTELAAARPYLERAARRPSLYRSYAELLLVASFGDGEVAELVEEQIGEAPKQAQALMIDLALTWLIHRGRTGDALAMLGTVDPQFLRSPIHWQLLGDLASAVGDRGTLERVLARHSSDASPAYAERSRAIADRAQGNVDAGNRRLRAVDVPPGSLPAHFLSLLLTHPTPVFDERALDGAAGRGLRKYREVAGSLYSTP